MPFKEKPIEKKYYSISEVAAENRLTVNGLLEWVNSFKELKGAKKGDITPFGRKLLMTKHQFDTCRKIRELIDMEVPLRTIKHYGLKNLDKMIEFFKSLNS